MTVDAIVTAYLDDDLDFESARDKLNALDPGVMREVLARATAPEPKALDLLIMVLADGAYPPALPAMRRWLEHEDFDNVAAPAAFALAAYAGDQFDVGTLYSLDADHADEMMSDIATWWDAGGANVPSEAEWLAERRAKRAQDKGDIPPPSPALTAEQNDALRPDVIALKNELTALPPERQHALDVAAIRRALPIYSELAPDDRVLHDALTAIDAFLAGGREPTAALIKRVRKAISSAHDAARWSAEHHAFRVPLAWAAGQVAQGVLYALSAEVSNRLQAMHCARDAIEYAGRGFAQVRAELDWQLASVRAQHPS